MTFNFEIPRVVDPDGVNASAYPRHMNVRSEKERLQQAADNDGIPITEFSGNSNPYIDYESIDLLLSLQHPRSTGYDEMCFIIMGQAKELLFKATYYELYNAQLRIREDDLSHAGVMLERAKRTLTLIVKFWDVLSTITTQGFNEFRDHLDVASGQQSFMYRHIEFILGNKVEKMCEVHSNVPHVYPAIRKNFESPSLYDEIISLLSRRKYDIAPECLERDWTKPYESQESVEKAWLAIYENPGPDNDLYMLGESLVELADIFSQYRWRHFVSVERIIGFKPGTGGSAGVGWLRSIVNHRFFPELWSIRSSL